MIPNPWIILLVVLAIAGAGIGGELAGHKAGVASQKVADQAQFDKINTDLTKQKAEANALLESEQAKLIAAIAERDRLKSNMEKEHAENLANIATLRRSYAGLSLRFRPEQAAGSGNGSGCANGAKGNPPSADDATVVQLPDSVTNGLRQLAEDADNLAADYKLCYQWATR